MKTTPIILFCVCLTALCALTAYATKDDVPTATSATSEAPAVVIPAPAPKARIVVDAEVGMVDTIELHSAITAQQSMVGTITTPTLKAMIEHRFPSVREYRGDYTWQLTDKGELVLLGTHNAYYPVDIATFNAIDEIIPTSPETSY